MNTKAAPAMKSTPAMQAMKKDIQEVKATVGEAVETVNNAVAAINTINDTVQTLANTVSTMAKHNIVAPNKLLSADEQFMGDEGNARIVEKNGSPIMQVPDGTHVDDPLFDEKMRIEQFNEGMIEVDILAPSDDQMPRIFEVSVNGESQIFQHDTRVRVKRKFVEVLARAKPSTFGNVEKNDPATGEKEYQYPVSKRLKYAFALVNPSQVESNWIRSVMAQP